MTPFKWEESFYTGVSEIDDQHKLFIKLINRLMDSIENNDPIDGVEMKFEKLMNYTAFHFGTEEDYMYSFKYPDYEKHKISHNAIFQKIIKCQQDLIESKTADQSQQTRSLLELTKFLYEWLREHIAVSDKKYVDLFKSKGL